MTMMEPDSKPTQTQSAVDLQLVESGIETRLLTGVVLRAKALRLAMRGVTAAKAAELLGVSPAHMREIYRDPEFRKAVMARLQGAFEETDETFEEKTKTLHEMLEEQAVQSFQELVSIARDMTSSNALKARIHMDLLNRVPESAQRKVNIDGGVLTSSMLQQAAKAAREMDNVLPMPSKQGEEGVA